MEALERVFGAEAWTVLKRPPTRCEREMGLHEIGARSREALVGRLNGVLGLDDLKRGRAAAREQRLLSGKLVLRERGALEGEIDSPAGNVALLRRHGHVAGYRLARRIEVVSCALGRGVSAVGFVLPARVGQRQLQRQADVRADDSESRELREACADVVVAEALRLNVGVEIEPRSIRVGRGALLDLGDREERPFLTAISGEFATARFEISARNVVWCRAARLPRLRGSRSLRVRGAAPGRSRVCFDRARSARASLPSWRAACRR